MKDQNLQGKSCDQKTKTCDVQKQLFQRVASFKTLDLFKLTIVTYCDYVTDSTMVNHQLNPDLGT